MICPPRVNVTLPTCAVKSPPLALPNAVVLMNPLSTIRFDAETLIGPTFWLTAVVDIPPSSDTTMESIALSAIFPPPGCRLLLPLRIKAPSDTAMLCAWMEISAEAGHVWHVAVKMPLGLLDIVTGPVAITLMFPPPARSF